MRIPSSAALFLCLLLHMTAPAAPAAAAHKTPFGADNCSPRPEAKRIESRAICPFTTTVDVNATRIPTHLPVVKCNCAYSLCSPQGDYRCKEVRTTFNVAYRVDGPELKYGTVQLTTSCVCAASRTATAETETKRIIDTDNNSP
ncbi:uncharacterized protein LOC144107003 [Amblyomma americanum]